MNAKPLLAAIVCLIPPAQPVEPVDLAGLAAWTADLRGYPRPPTLPKFTWAPGDALDARLCRRSACRIMGAYEKGVIYVRAGTDGPDLEVIVVHELSHWLDDLNTDHMWHCKSERLAAWAEWNYMAIVGHSLVERAMWDPGAYNCPSWSE